MILRVFDVSEYIYAGNRGADIVRLVEDSAPYRVESLPVGGVRHILREIKRYHDENTQLVFCMDRIPTFKRQLFDLWWKERGGYKGNRKPKDPDIMIQQSLAEDILNELGVNVLAKEGYEADDMIANVVNYYADSYEKIYIHARDSDLYYLVRDNVEIMPVGHFGKHIDIRNYETTVNCDYNIKYNLSMLHRLGKGGKDNVPKVSKEDYEKICDLLDFDSLGSYGDVHKLEEVIIRACGKGSAWRVFRIVAPWTLELEDVMLFEEELKEDVYQGFMDILDSKRTNISICNELINNYFDLYGRR